MIGQGTLALGARRESFPSFNLDLTEGLDTGAVQGVARPTSIRITYIHSSRMLLNRVPNPAIHRILHINHKSIEDMEKRLMRLRKAWVEEKEKLIVFGNGKSWADIEADETTFTNADFKDLAEDPKKPVGWEQWYGLVPDTLLLKRLFPLMSAKPAPDPGAIRNVEWKSLAHKHLQNRRGILTLMPPSPIACVCLVSFMTMSDTARRESM